PFSPPAGDTPHARARSPAASLLAVAPPSSPLPIGAVRHKLGATTPLPRGDRPFRSPKEVASRRSFHAQRMRRIRTCPILHCNQPLAKRRTYGKFPRGKCCERHPGCSRSEERRVGKEREARERREQGT